MGIGHIRTKTHDYQRPRDDYIVCALNDLDGKILSRTATRHTHVVRLGFLKQLDRETPATQFVDELSGRLNEEPKRYVCHYCRYVILLQMRQALLPIDGDRGIAV